MGVKSTISLKEAQSLFSEYSLTQLIPTSNGVVDTTYISGCYILKKYERPIVKWIEEDSLRLEHFESFGLNVSTLITQREEWYLYKRLEGKTPTTISYYHIQALARFMAKLHQQKVPVKKQFIEQYQIEKKLLTLKSFSYFYYKKVAPLRDFQGSQDGFIHGDIFKDNTLFHEEKIAVIDFIDGGLGSFAFDIAVALLSFNPKDKPSLNRLFLSTYNQYAPKKIALTELKKHREIAAMFYALLRIDARQNIARVKELL